MSTTVTALFLVGNAFTMGMLASVIFILDDFALRLALAVLFFLNAMNCVRNFFALVPA